MVGEVVEVDNINDAIRGHSGFVRPHTHPKRLTISGFDIGPNHGHYLLLNHKLLVCFWYLILPKLHCL